MIKINPQLFQSDYKTIVSIDPANFALIDKSKIVLDSLRNNFNPIMSSLLYDNFLDSSYPYKDFVREYIALCIFLNVSTVTTNSTMVQKILAIKDIYKISFVKKITNCSTKKDYISYFKTNNFDEFKKNIRLKMKFINGMTKSKKWTHPFKNAQFINIKVKRTATGYFNYDRIDSNLKKRYYETLKIETCPYCNHSFINTIENEKDINTFDIDHFYPQSIFPLFSLSLFNFVPSCKNCNQSFKHDFYKVDKIINPVLESFGDEAVFYLKPNGSDFKVELNLTDCSPNKRLKCEESNKLFNITNLYSCHQKYIKDIVKKRTEYGPQVIKKLKKVLRSLKLDDSDAAINKMLYGLEFTEQDDRNYIMSKFTRDVIKNYDE